MRNSVKRFSRLVFEAFESPYPLALKETLDIAISKASNHGVVM